MTRRRILIADDEALMAQGLKLFLESSGEFEVIALAGTGQEAVDLTADLAPAGVLMDLSMPVLDGIAATRLIRARHPEVKIVVVTTFATTDSVVPALRAGADGYLLKESTPEELVAAVHEVFGGGRPLSPRVTEALIAAVGDTPAAPDPAPDGGREAHPPPLTEREREVLDLLAQGLSNPAMARELSLSEAAVKSRLVQLTTKFGVSSRVQVLVRACELGLVKPRLRPDPAEHPEAPGYPDYPV